MRVRLIHWNPEEAGERAGYLEKRGITVDFEPFDRETLKRAGEDPPDAVIIDLTRIPSQGRDIAVALRRRRSTRNIPLVFAGGSSEKTARVKRLLPDAYYFSWENMAGSLKAAVKDAPADPVVPSSQFAAYSGKPLSSRLGIHAGARIILLDPPDGFERALGVLPDGAAVRKRAAGKGEIVILFCRSMRDLERRLEKTKSLMATGGSLWIAWQKKASGKGSDLTQAAVRRKGLGSGLVDYRICSIDAEWSGLRFARRGG